MPVDPQKPRKILVVHGVQTAEDEDLDQHLVVEELVRNRLGDIPVQFATQMYRYENVNDEAREAVRDLMKTIGGTPIGTPLTDAEIDLVGDVVISLADGSTAKEIRDGLMARILGIFDDQNPCYLLAHSLGSIYAFDVVNELIRAPGLFERASRKTWPVQGLTTIGSPIGLGMFRRRRPRVADLGPGEKFLRWVNYWDRTDPIVSGRIFGTQLRGLEIAERYQRSSPNQGWVIRDRPVDTGKLWLLGHVSYWSHPAVGDGLVDMIAN